MDEGSRLLREQFDSLSPDSELYTLLSEMAGKSTPRQDRVATLSDETGLGLLSLFLALVLYRWGMDILNARRNKQELKDAEQRIRLVKQLSQELHFPRDIAEEMVNRTLDAIAKRNKNDSAVTQLLESVTDISRQLPEVSSTSFTSSSEEADA